MVRLIASDDSGGFFSVKHIKWLWFDLSQWNQSHYNRLVSHTIWSAVKMDGWIDGLQQRCRIPIQAANEKRFIYTHFSLIFLLLFTRTTAYIDQLLLEMK